MALQHGLTLTGLVSTMRMDAYVTPTYAPINIMPHYPPPRLCRGKGGPFDLF